MRMLRTKSVGTKVTEDEYATLERLAAGRTLMNGSVRCCSRPSHRGPFDQALLAEVLALRTIVLNLHFAAVAGETPTPDAMRGLIERADRDKHRKAQERLASAAGRESR